MIRGFIPTHESSGDTDKLTTLIYSKLVDSPNPPLRLPLGKDSITMIKASLSEMLADMEKHESWSDGLTFDDN